MCVFVRFSCSPCLTFVRICRLHMCCMKVVCVDLSQTYTQTDRYACTCFVSFCLRFPMPFWLRFNSHTVDSVSMHNEFRVCAWVCVCVYTLHAHTLNLIVLTIFAMTFYYIRFFWTVQFDFCIYKRTEDTLSVDRLSFRVEFITHRRIQFLKSLQKFIVFDCNRSKNQILCKLMNCLGDFFLSFSTWFGLFSQLFLAREYSTQTHLYTSLDGTQADSASASTYV